MHVGEFLGDLLEGDGLREADGDDRVLPPLGKTPMRLLELRLGGSYSGEYYCSRNESRNGKIRHGHQSQGHFSTRILACR
jgi:hypothetical protein